MPLDAFLRRVIAIREREQLDDLEHHAKRPPCISCGGRMWASDKAINNQCARCRARKNDKKLH